MTNHVISRFLGLSLLVAGLGACTTTRQPIALASYQRVEEVALPMQPDAAKAQTSESPSTESQLSDSEEPTLVASTEKMPGPFEIQTVRKQIADARTELNHRQAGNDKMSWLARALTNKVLKKTDRSLRAMEHTRVKDEKAVQRGLNQNVKLGIIFAAIGILLMLLAGAGTTYTVGLVLLILGVVLFLLGVL